MFLSVRVGFVSVDSVYPNRTEIKPNWKKTEPNWKPNFKNFVDTKIQKKKIPITILAYMSFFFK